MAESLISTPGGKFWLKHKIIPYFYKPHEAYIEVFGGAGHILLEKSPSIVEVYNDVDNDLYCFFKVLRDCPDRFLFYIEMSPYSRKLFDELKAIEPSSDFYRAWRFYCINRMAFAGHRPYKASFGYGIQRKMAFHRYEKFLPVIRRLHNVIIENLDFREILEKYDGSNVLFYLDPPYHGSEHHYEGGFDFTKKDHEDLVDLLKKAKGKWLLSYDDNPFVRESYKQDGIYIIEISVKYDATPVVDSTGVYTIGDMEYEKLFGQHNSICLTKDKNERLERKELLIANYDLGAFDAPLLTFNKEDETCQR